MDLDELRSVRRTERQRDSLQHLRDSFYEDVAAYIAERKAERQRAAEAADDPFGDPQVGELTDEIETAEDVVEAIYERRVGKVVKLASFAAADMSADKAGLTAEERALFEDLVARIKENRSAILDVLAGEGGDADVDDAGSEPSDAGTVAVDGEAGGIDTESPAASAAPAESPDADSPPTPDDVLAAAMGEDGGFEPDGGAESAEADIAARDADPSPDVPATSSQGSDTPDAPEPPAVDPDGAPAVDGDGEPPTVESQPDARNGGADAGSHHNGTDRVTLRITEDVGEILGVDEREYDLAAEDVVTLPSTNAGPLVDRDAAERLD